MFVRHRTLMWELAAFFLSGGISCSLTGIEKMIPILENKPPVGSEEDQVYKWIALGGIVFFVALKAPVFFRLRDIEMERIEKLDRPYFFQCYQIPKVLLLASLILSMKVVENATSEYYGVRLAMGAMVCAVGFLLTVCCVGIVAKLLQNPELGVVFVSNQADKLVTKEDNDIMSSVV